MGTTKFEVGQMRLSLSLVTLFFLWSAAAVIADDSKLESRIKKYVFEGCAKAEADTAKLSEADKRDLVVFLGRVLELKLGGTTNVLQDAVRMSKPPSSIPVYNESGELWRTFNPNHERQAKQCALKILSYVNRNAIGELAKVLSYAVAYHETGAEREVEEIVSAARHIFRKGFGFVSPEIERRSLMELFELRAETRFPLIDEFAAELAAVHTDLLIEELMHDLRERRLYAIRIAARLGLGSREVGEKLIGFFHAVDILKRRDIATMLAGFESEEIRLRFLMEVIYDMENQAVLDGDILNSFGFAVKSLPRESFQKLSPEEITRIEKLFFVGKQIAILEPLVVKIAEAGLLSLERLRELANAPDPSTRIAELALIDGAAVSDSAKLELYLLLLQSWLKISPEARPNGVALQVVRKVHHLHAPPKQINRAISLLAEEIDELLKGKPQQVPAGYREQVEAIGFLGAEAFRLIPKSMANSELMDLRELLALGIMSADKLDPRSTAYLKRVAGESSTIDQALKEQGKGNKIVIEQIRK